jgi:hypothetical protein
VRRITENPRQFPIVFTTLRRARAEKFPYALFFLVESDALLVVACFHSSRDRATGKGESDPITRKIILSRKSTVDPLIAAVVDSTGKLNPRRL